MNIERVGNKELIDPRVRYWLEKKDLLDIYRSLRSWQKAFLSALLLRPDEPASDNQLKELGNALGLGQTKAGKGGRPADAINSMTNEQLREFFTLTPGERLHNLSKY